MNAMNELKTDSTNAAWHQRRLDATPRGVGVFGDFFIDRAKNAEFWDIEGRRFIDFAGGIAVLNTGHVHPKVQAAIAAQLQRFTHSCYQVVPYTEYVALAERINAIVPIDGPVKTAFFSTGAEAIENAMKIARYSTGRTGGPPMTLAWWPHTTRRSVASFRLRCWQIVTELQRRGEGWGKGGKRGKGRLHHHPGHRLAEGAPGRGDAARAQLAAECGDASRVHALVCDVGDEAQVDIAFAQSVAALGTVHACFANAGVSGKGNMLMDMQLEEFRRVQRINVDAGIVCVQVALPHWRMFMPSMLNRCLSGSPWRRL